MTTECRILVVTGAGASRSLGMGESGMLPLMDGWAASLREQLGGPAADRLGLVAGMSGPEFEAQVGNLLQVQAMLPTLRGMDPLGSNVGSSGSPISPWVDAATRHLHDFQHNLSANLFKNFDWQEIDEAKAVRLLRAVSSYLGTRQGNSGIITRLAYATTNYDHALELALGDQGDDGLAQESPGQPRTLRPTFADDVWSNEQTPVVHLHGAAGWYIGTRGHIEEHYGHGSYYQEIGPPAIMAPDPNKTERTFTTGRSLWDAFRALVHQAHGILILGHSLGDRDIIEQLSASQKPLGVGTYVPNPERAKVSSDETNRVNTTFAGVSPRPVVIATDLGSTSDMFDSTTLMSWLHEVDQYAHNHP